MFNNKPLVNLLICAFFLCLFAFGASSFLDPDFGWHLRNGEIILNIGIPKTDPYSYSMPSYPYVDYEWLADVLLAASYHAIGFSGLAIVLAAVALGCLVIAVGKSTLKDWTIQIALLFLGAACFSWFIAVRPVIITWLSFSVMVGVVYDQKWWNRFRFFLPLFFLLWANLHAGFIAGLGVFFIKVAASFLESGKRQGIINAAVFGLSLLATLVNPYGIGLWFEIWFTISNSFIFQRIAELIPFYRLFSPVVTILIILPIPLLIWYRRKFSLSHFGTYLLTVWLVILANRNVPLLAIAVIPILKSGWSFLKEDLALRGAPAVRLVAASKFILVISLVIWSVQMVYVFIGHESLQEERFYPKNAVKHIDTHPTDFQIFAPYDWGGYLIWKLPEKKVFVDGRMPYWKQSPRVGESDNAFSESIQLLQGELNTEKFLEKYQISMILWPKPSKGGNNFYQYLENILRLDKDTKTFDFLAKLRGLGWKKVYEDEVAVIYRAPGH